MGVNWASGEVVGVFTFLLPGFVAAAVFYTLTSHARPGAFGYVVMALIFQVNCRSRNRRAARGSGHGQGTHAPAFETTPGDRSGAGWNFAQARNRHQAASAASAASEEELTGWRAGPVEPVPFRPGRTHRVPHRSIGRGQVN